MRLEVGKYYEDGLKQTFLIYGQKGVIYFGHRVSDLLERTFYADGRVRWEELGSKSTFNLYKELTHLPQIGSGTVKDEQKLTAFVYLLLRDHIPSGKLNKIMDDIANIGERNAVYSDKNLEAMAQDFAKRLGE